MIKHKKVKVNQIDVESRYQRVLDERRAQAMARDIDMDRIGVPSLSLRANGKLVVIDGQHRVAALMYASKGSLEIMCEVHEGLTVRQEAALFLKLNGGRKAVSAFDKYVAELAAKVPATLEIEAIVTGLGLRVARAKGPRHICAVDALRYAHLRRKNLSITIGMLKLWTEDDPNVFDGDLIKAVSFFLSTYTAADAAHLAGRLRSTSPESVQRRIDRTISKSDGVSRTDAVCIVLRDLYNKNLKHNRLPPLHVILDGAEEAGS